MVIGFMMSLAKNNISIENKNIVILGSGGAARIIAMKLAKTMSKDDIMIVNLSGRGDKDVEQVSDYITKNGIAL